MQKKQFGIEKQHLFSSNNSKKSTRLIAQFFNVACKMKIVKILCNKATNQQILAFGQEGSRFPTVDCHFGIFFPETLLNCNCSMEKCHELRTIFQQESLSINYLPKSILQKILHANSKHCKINQIQIKNACSGDEEMQCHLMVQTSLKRFCKSKP